jgi:hypothetical protein
MPEDNEEPVAARPDPEDNEELAAHSEPDRREVKKAAAALTKALKAYNLPSIRFVAHSLGLDMSGPDKKANYTAKLTAWVSLIQSISVSASNTLE